MGILYERIKELCEEKGIKIAQMCREAGVYQGAITDLKMKRSSSLSASNLQKIARYFGVSVDYLMGEETTKPPADTDEELWELRQALHDRPELKVMFDLTKNATPAEVKKMLKVLQLMKEDDVID